MHPAQAATASSGAIAWSKRAGGATAGSPLHARRPPTPNPRSSGAPARALGWFSRLRWPAPASTRRQLAAGQGAGQRRPNGTWSRLPRGSAVALGGSADNHPSKSLVKVAGRRIGLDSLAPAQGVDGLFQAGSSSGERRGAASTDSDDNRPRERAELWGTSYRSSGP